MSNEKEDLAWKALEETAKKVAPEISIELLEKAYSIQKSHQFNRDRSESMQLMEKLIETQIGDKE